MILQLQWKILASKKEDDFLYTFAMSTHNRMFGHLCGRTSTQMQKNELLGRERNLRKGETGMERTAGSSKVVGKNQRKKSTTNNRANDDTVNHDNKFQVGLVSAALGEGNDTTIEEAVPKMINFLVAELARNAQNRVEAMPFRALASVAAKPRAQR